MYFRGDSEVTGFESDFMFYFAKGIFHQPQKEYKEENK